MLVLAAVKTFACTCSVDEALHPSLSTVMLTFRGESPNMFVYLRVSELLLSVAVDQLCPVILPALPVGVASTANGSHASTIILCT